MRQNREWMYRQRGPDGSFNPDFVAGLETFIEFATSHLMFMDGKKIKCPCGMCDNKSFRDTNTVRYHISKHGFVRNYYTWRFHGEASVPLAEEEEEEEEEEDRDMDSDDTDTHGETSLPLAEEDRNMDSDDSDASSTATSQFKLEAYDHHLVKIQQQLQDEREVPRRLQDQIQEEREAQRRMQDQIQEEREALRRMQDQIQEEQEAQRRMHDQIQANLRRIEQLSQSRSVFGHPPPPPSS